MDYEKKIGKIRKLLGDRFHLGVGIDIDGIKSWVLYKKYKDSKIYFSEDNEEIMSSETNTLEDLMKFAKKHHRVDEHVVINNTVLIVLCVSLIVCLINPFIWNSGYIRAIVLTIDFFGLLITYVSHIVWNKNWKVEMYELNEYFIRNRKEIEEKLNGLGNKKSNKRRISKRVGKSSNKRRDS